MQRPHITCPGSELRIFIPAPLPPWERRSAEHPRFGRGANVNVSLIPRKPT